MSLWGGGRFEDDPADALWRFTVDREDKRLLAYDVRGSIAHVEAELGDSPLVNEKELCIYKNGHKCLSYNFV